MKNLLKYVSVAAAVLVLALIVVPHAASAQWYYGFGGYSFNPNTDALYIDGVRVEFWPPNEGGDNGGGGGSVSMDTQCPDGSTVPEGQQCPPTTKVCQDGSVVAINDSCPPLTKQCPDGSTVDISAQCPPTTKQCPDGSVVAINAQCAPNTCQDPSASNYGGSLPCDYPPALCTDPSASNYGNSLPCQYVPIQYCNDPAALNYGQPGDCDYPPAVTICQDPSASNYGGSLPCDYPPICSDPSALNYGQEGSCSYPPQNVCEDPNANNYGQVGGCTYGGGGNNGDNNNAQTGFTISGPNSVSATFIGTQSGESQVASVTVNPVGGFDSDVAVGVSSTSCPNVSGYSFDGGPYTSSPATVMRQNPSGWYAAPSGNLYLAVRVGFSSPIPSPCQVTIAASGGGKSADFTMTVHPDSKNPQFQEF